MHTSAAEEETTSNDQQMRFGDLELRKTAEGWKYLSEGIGGENDTWCDATSALSPFSGSGVNHLLDALLAAQKLEAQRASSVCKNCSDWKNGCCYFIDTIQGEKVAATTGCTIIATAHDDSGMQVDLRTGPDFSCPNFSKKA